MKRLVRGGSRIFSIQKLIQIFVDQIEFPNSREPPKSCFSLNPLLGEHLDSLGIENPWKKEGLLQTPPSYNGFFSPFFSIFSLNKFDKIRPNVFLMVIWPLSCLNALYISQGRILRGFRDSNPCRLKGSSLCTIFWYPFLADFKGSFGTNRLLWKF